jgi:DNA-binding HxlR family transcriptional regulator
MEIVHTKESCSSSRRAIQDTLEVINGKWKLLILVTLQERALRFKELVREIGVTPRMLSKELQDMEMNKLISRTVYQTKPIAVEYAITEHGKTLNKVLEEMKNWGMSHRNKIMKEE